MEEIPVMDYEFADGEVIKVIDWEAFKSLIWTFAISNNISLEKAEEFCQYHDDCHFLVENPDLTKLYDKNGNIIKNWKGAFINFSKVKYDRNEWCQTNLR